MRVRIGYAYQIRGKTMTQLVGAICEDGKKVITVSDRMVSTGDMTLMFEQPRSKVELIAPRAIVLSAGTVHEPDLTREARVRAKGKDRILEIAEVLKDVFQEIREKHIVDEVLRPQTGIRSFAEWHAKQRSMHDAIVISLNEEIKQYELRLSLILAGADNEGHLIMVGDPGTYRSFDNLSYCCRGMGERHADNVFAWYRYSRIFPLNEALYIAFEAKKKAEMAGGVGQSTDILIIDSDGINKVSPDTVTALEEIYHDREAKAERTEFDNCITELEVRTGKMEGS
jgi:hypothetical protein